MHKLSFQKSDSESEKEGGIGNPKKKKNVHLCSISVTVLAICKIAMSLQNAKSQVPLYQNGARVSFLPSWEEDKVLEIILKFKSSHEYNLYLLQFFD